MTYPNDPMNGAQTPQSNPQFRPQIVQVASPISVGPPRFWQIVLKDLAMTIVGVSLFCIIAFLLVFSAFVVLAKSIGSIDSGSDGFTETTIQGDESSDGKVVILPIEGVIETDETGFIPEAIDAIRDDDRVRALVLRVNSPGGTISGSDYYLHLLKELKEDLDIPVIVSMGDLAASGGYYISTIGDKIFAERSTMTGSIGVIVSMYNAAELCKKLGVRSSSITSGPMKGMGDFMKEPTPEETAIWQKTVDDSYEQFLSVIKEGRAWYRGEEETNDAPKPKRERLAGVDVETVAEDSAEEDQAQAAVEDRTPSAEPSEELAEVDATEDEADETAELAEEKSATEEEVVQVAEEKTPSSVPTDLKGQRDAELRKLADGRIYSAQDAKDLHLIDEIGFIDDAIDAAIDAAGLTQDSAQVVRYEEETGLLDSFMSARAQANSLEKALKTFSSPRGYYLCPRVLP